MEYTLKKLKELEQTLNNLYCQEFIGGFAMNQLKKPLNDAINSLNQRERQPVTDNKGNGSGCINLLHHEDIEEYGGCYYCKETKS